MAITAQDVKLLREKTGAGMMDCKKALTECDGDMEKAIDWLREKGISKAAKKQDRIAAEGLTRLAVDGNVAVIFEVNSETDFAAKNENFLNVLDTVSDVLLAHKPANMEAALASTSNGGSTLDEIITDATATIGEKISFRRFEVIEKSDADTFGAYMHMGGKISCVVVLKDIDNAEVAKDVAMHAAAMNPQFIDRKDISQEFLDHERAIQTEIMKNDEALANKPEKVLLGIVEGRLSKQLQEICLNDQPFFKDPDLKISQYVGQAKSSVVRMVRYGVGEGIEKKVDNFAEEVMNQMR